MIWQQNRYYIEWAEPQGLHDAVSVALMRDATRVGRIAFANHRTAGEIVEPALAGLRLLAPHIRRAVTISNLFDLKAIEVSTFASAIEAFGAGVVLVGQDLGIVHTNATAEAMLHAKDPILSRQGRLGLRHQVTNGALEAALLQAVQDEAKLGQKGIAIPARREDGTPLVLHVLPLGRGEIRPALCRPPRPRSSLPLRPRRRACPRTRFGCSTT